jgi:hypothetical protein
MASVKPEMIMNAVLDFPVAQYGTFLATRASGQSVRADLEARVKSQGYATTVYIRFDDVEAMTISFADEFIGHFYSSMAVGDVATAGVLLSGFNAETREAVAICLERRDVAALASDNNHTILIGRTESIAETFQAALQLKEFRANDIAAKLSITPQNANNRLKRLLEAGALQRKQVPISNRGGKEFVYKVIESPTKRPMRSHRQRQVDDREPRCD